MKAEEQLEKFKLELADLMEKYDVHICVENDIDDRLAFINIECNPAYFDTIDNSGSHSEYVGQYISSETLRNN